MPLCFESDRAHLKEQAGQRKFGTVSKRCRRVRRGGTGATHGTPFQIEEIRMKVMVIGKATRASESGAPPSAEALTAMVQFNEELVKAGVLVAAEGLLPSREGKRVRFSAEGCTVIDGPFPETKELIAGFSIWEVRSMEEALDWVRRCPMGAGAEMEIRPLFRWKFDEADEGQPANVKVQDKEQELWRQGPAAKKAG
jgi:hypothetical protein